MSDKIYQALATFQALLWSARPFLLRLHTSESASMSSIQSGEAIGTRLYLKTRCVLLGLAVTVGMEKDAGDLHLAVLIYCADFRFSHSHLSDIARKDLRRYED